MSNGEIRVSITEIPKIREALEKADKEIERLKKREQECIDHYLVQCKYAGKMEEKYIIANNIINKLEKDLEHEIKEYKEDGYDILEIRKANLWLTGCYDEEKNILEKLQELKGSDK